MTGVSVLLRGLPLPAAAGRDTVKLAIKALMETVEAGSKSIEVRRMHAIHGEAGNIVYAQATACFLCVHHVRPITRALGGCHGARHGAQAAQRRGGAPASNWLPKGFVSCVLLPVHAANCMPCVR